MTPNEKIELLARFFANTRNENDDDLDKLFLLQDYWEGIYNENRIRLGFEEARILANESVIAHVLNGESEVENG